MIEDTRHTATVSVNATKRPRSTPEDPWLATIRQGSDSRVEWNPRLRPRVQRDKGGGQISADHADPAEVFHHEMMHSDHTMQGTSDYINVDPNSTIDGKGRTVVTPTPREEMRTIGLSGVREGDSTEHDASNVLGNDPRATWQWAEY